MELALGMLGFHYVNPAQNRRFAICGFCYTAMDSKLLLLLLLLLFLLLAVFV